MCRPIEFELAFEKPPIPEGKSAAKHLRRGAAGGNALCRGSGGWHDSQLTPAGARPRIPEDAEVEVFSSDRQRDLQTARVVGDLLHVEPVVDRRLREKSYGQAEGKPQAWLDQRFIPPSAVGDRMRHDEGLPGAEAKASFAQRIYAVMDAILESSCDHQIIVTHDFAVTFALAWWIRMQIESLGYVNFRVDSGSITELWEDDYFHNRQIVGLSDTRHLAT